MATTELRAHPLDAASLDGCLALTRAAGWNQNAADWRLMLEIGRGWGLTRADGTLVASTLVLPYGGFAWVSMVLVLPEQRRQGFAARLLRTALADLRAAGLTPVLDATPAGRAVYLREGFHDNWGFRRYQLANDVPARRRTRADGVRPLAADDWPQLLALDAKAFGASRERLLRALAMRLPAAALVLERSGAIRGFLLGREGQEAWQLGPLVVDSDAGDDGAGTAQALLDAALGELPVPIYLDAADHAASLVVSLAARGFACQRPFTRMVFGAGGAPGDAAKIMLVAGPELG
jgi:ribosomal protein S18 acetylase RimI-like enzyme